MPTYRLTAPGPFRADQIRNKDPYELSNGHPILCLPTQPDGGVAQARGAAVIASDPLVEEAGTEIGFQLNENTLRAPDVAVVSRKRVPGTPDEWVKAAPPLAIEYAGPGQNWKDLKVKIEELLAAGTRQVWVVRVDGPRRVEVHEKGQAMRPVGPGNVLTLPGVLANPVPVEALYDSEAANQAIFRNMLQRYGYRDLEELQREAREEGILTGRQEGEQKGREEGREAGREEGALNERQRWLATTRTLLLQLAEQRFGAVPPGLLQEIEAVQDVAHFQDVLQKLR